VGEWTIYKPDGTVAGYYHTFYEGGSRSPARRAPRQPSADTLTTASGPAVPYNKPPIRLPRQRSRYFITRLNEFRGVIVGVNPVAPVLGGLPLSVEYYYRERLGYEAGYILYRRPFLKEANAMPLEKLYNRGFGVYLRQKFYQPDDALGMFYLAHEVRFTDVDHRLHVSEADDSGLPYRRTLQADENLYEYSIMVGTAGLPTRAAGLYAGRVPRHRHGLPPLPPAVDRQLPLRLPLRRRPQGPGIGAAPAGAEHRVRVLMQIHTSEQQESTGNMSLLRAGPVSFRVPHFFRTAPDF
jgi:hypothetical protein